jgi:RNA polymerase sigma-70 factor (ECF subfamily)
MLEEYYRKHYQKHVASIKRKCSTPDVASDIVQEAFTRACKGMGSFDPKKGNFGNWFSKILYRTYLDHTQKEYREAESVSLYLPLEDLIDYEVVYENREIIDKALETLDEKRKFPIKLFYRDGYSVEQIHNITKISETYIRQLCFRFKNKLRDEWNLEL